MKCDQDLKTPGGRVDEFRKQSSQLKSGAIILTGTSGIQV